jgi:uncharacterized protein YbbC (DUF1343 family)/CubicO group peptidase (beta-lactamase class C family)
MSVRVFVFLSLLVLACSRTAVAQNVDPARPARPTRVAPARPAQVDPERLARIDPLVTEAIAQRKLSGAVVLVGIGDRVVYRKAFGARALEPAREAMTLDTIFDAASLTKVAATTTSVLALVEQGRIRLSDRVAIYVPGFERYGKRDITIRHLLTHTSGLRPDVDLTFDWVGADRAIELAVEEVPIARIDERMIYSDINFFLLGHIVGKVSGERLDRFARTRIFEPLGMRDTTFLPAVGQRGRIAPTEKCTQYGWPCEGPNQQMLRGTVHDPTARRMGGVAGHAGLFTTADDLAIFCRMLLGGGAVGAARVLSPLTVARMTMPSTPAGERNVRGLGWDVDSSFSSNRGELLPLGSFGHTGFTGTSIWIDPTTRAFVVFLSSRLHPDGKGDVTPLRAQVATAAAAAIVSLPADRAQRLSEITQAPGRALAPAGAVAAAPARPPVMTGIDVLRAEGFERLKGRRVGLVTNHTGRARDGSTSIDLFAAAKNLTLVALFSPEHGIRGVLDEKVPSSKDEKTGLTIHSLYGETRRPTDDMLKGIDTMVVDLQDVGARIYTYPATMMNVMEEAAKRNIEVVVLDRPNPVNGWQIEGSALDESLLGFTGVFRMPQRYALTLGEMARLLNEEKGIKAKLTVVALQHWRRDQWFDETGAPWINPSPNMRNLIQATLYPGIGAIEASNISVGRGTDTPFEQLGAPWIDGVALAAALNARNLPGVRFYPVRFTPTSSKYVKEECGGVFIVVTDREALRPVRVGLEVAAALMRLYPRDYRIAPDDRLFGSRDSLRRAAAGEDPAAIAASWAGDEARWRLLRAKYLLYTP